MWAVCRYSARSSPVEQCQWKLSWKFTKVCTNNHLGVLRYSHTLALDELDIVQPTKNLVLDLELGTHGEFGALLDLEGVIL